MRVQSDDDKLLRIGPAMLVLAIAFFASLPAIADTPGFRASDVTGLPEQDAEPQANDVAVPVPVSDELRNAVAHWIDDLDGERFQTRRQAARNLVRSGAAAIGPLSVAAAEAESQEVGRQAVDVLQELCLSAESRTRDAARGALEQLAQARNRAVALHAAAALRSQRMLLHLRAVDRIRRLGGSVETYESPAGDYIGTTVLLGREWRGREAGLVHVKDLLGVERAGLKGEDFTDAALKVLLGLPELKMVQLYGTRITAAGERSLQEMMPNGKIDRRDGALLGVSGSAGLQGCQIEYVLPGSAANQAGLEVGDVITQFDGHAVQDFPGLTALIARKKSGDKASLEILRDEEKLEKEVQFGELELDSFQ